MAKHVPKHDAVNHPAHYTSHPSGVQAITITEHFSYNVGNAIKYLWRAGNKGSTVEDLRKARWYVEREIQKLATDSDRALRTAERHPTVTVTHTDGAPTYVSDSAIRTRVPVPTKRPKAKR
jgi:hypothetical protein